MFLLRVIPISVRFEGGGEQLFKVFEVSLDFFHPYENFHLRYRPPYLSSALHVFPVIGFDLGSFPQSNSILSIDTWVSAPFQDSLPCGSLG